MATNSGRGGPRQRREAGGGDGEPDQVADHEPGDERGRALQAMREPARDDGGDAGSGRGDRERVHRAECEKSVDRHGYLGADSRQAAGRGVDGARIIRGAIAALSGNLPCACALVPAAAAVFAPCSCRLMPETRASPGRWPFMAARASSSAASSRRKRRSPIARRCSRPWTRVRRCFAVADRASMPSKPRSACSRTIRCSTPDAAPYSRPTGAMSSTPRSWTARRARRARWPA